MGSRRRGRRRLRSGLGETQGCRRRLKQRLHMRFEWMWTVGLERVACRVCLDSESRVKRRVKRVKKIMRGHCREHSCLSR